MKGSKAESIFSKRGGYSGSKLKSLPKVTSSAPTAKVNSKGAAQNKA